MRLRRNHPSVRLAVSLACVGALSLSTSGAAAHPVGGEGGGQGLGLGQARSGQPGAVPAVDTEAGYAGHCLDDLGVTVVVDFQDLGPWQDQDGEDLVRCATSGIPGVPFDGTGVDALHAAGIQVTGTDRWGQSFICRLEGRPAADEPLPIDGNPGYTEPCIDTPPGSAYWSYWHSDDTTWTYSSLGASNRTAPPGTYEGWSFALNAGATTNPQPSLSPGAPATQRISGVNRYATAAEIAGRYPSGVDTVYVATGANYPDALAGATLAGRDEAPVLLTAPGSIPSATRSALTHLQPGSIVVLGGPGSVTQTVLTQLADLTDGAVTRVSGSDRYATAAEISKAYAAGVDTVYVTTGSSFPDALSVSALAGMQGAPILLTRPGGLPSATRSALERLDPGSIVVVGGEGAVSTQVFNQLKAYVPAPGDVSRLNGVDRYDTSRQVAEQFPTGSDVSFVATGGDFPDALAGAALAGRFSGPVVLTRPQSLPTAAETALGHLMPRRIVVLGGTGAVSNELVELLEEFVVTP